MNAVHIPGLLGILLIIGFLAEYLFRKTSIPDILILIVLGYLIGPVLYIVEPSDLTPATQVIATLALVVILFDGGLNLDLSRILRSAHRAVLLVSLGIGISMAATAAFAYYLLEWGLPNSLLLGAIVSGTSPSIVMPLISRARVTDEISSVLSLESALNGALVIIIALVVLDIMSTGTAQNRLAVAGKAIAMEFSLDALVGVLAGILAVGNLRV